MKLSQVQREAFANSGFVILPDFASHELVDEMLEHAIDITRRQEAGGDIFDALIQPESALADPDLPLARKTSKIFRIHKHEPVFEQFASDPRTTQIIADLIGEDLDCFLSQFIFKQPGALGQPWHQDAFYFPFDGPDQGSYQVGIWLAITEARRDNGPLWVLPGSHNEEVHAAVKDTREHANHGYFEIIDHDMEGAIPVFLQPGDLLIFHSHLMHMSTDNESDDLRAAMVYHYAHAATIDHSEAVYGHKPANQEWVPVLRAGQPV